MITMATFVPRLFNAFRKRDIIVSNLPMFNNAIAMNLLLK
jgi:hypothetical protein